MRNLEVYLFGLGILLYLYKLNKNTENFSLEEIYELEDDSSLGMNNLFNEVDLIETTKVSRENEKIMIGKLKDEFNDKNKNGFEVIDVGRQGVDIPQDSRSAEYLIDVDVKSNIEKKINSNELNSLKEIYNSSVVDYKKINNDIESELLKSKGVENGLKLLNGVDGNIDNGDFKPINSLSNLGSF